MEHKHTGKSIGIGVVLLLTGIALLLSNLGILSYEIRQYILRWEMFPIVLGLVFIFSPEKRGPGIVMLAVGGALYARHYIDIQVNFWQVFFSVMLILIGVLIIFKNNIDSPPCQKKSMSDDDFIDEVAVFGGGDRTIISQNFLGGKILAIFGGSNFNLTRAKLAPGKNYIDVLAVFGGMKLIVPEDWNVKINAISIFGGFSDKHRISPAPSSNTSESQLIIKGFVIFGGGEIKSF